jgi:hypothetical protein
MLLHTIGILAISAAAALLIGFGLWRAAEWLLDRSE